MQNFLENGLENMLDIHWF